jgi:hypothetical protein
MSNEARALVLVVKGMISEMPEADRAVVADCADHLKSIVRAHGEAGMIALALVSAELGEANENLPRH